ncbi:MAG: hypothetical protein Q7J03_03615 [Methanoregula sp.]|nr:hypothetical protein [Methanoregula sp.]
MMKRGFSSIAKLRILIDEIAMNAAAPEGAPPRRIKARVLHL